MTLTSKKVIQDIATAFAERSLPVEDSVFFSFSSEIDTKKIITTAKTTSWLNFPHELIYSNPEALNYTTSAAFTYLLPAYLIQSIAMYSQTGILTTSILSNLTPPDQTDADQFNELLDDLSDELGIYEDSSAALMGADDEILNLFNDRVNLLNVNEKKAIKYYLLYIAEFHGDDFPLFGPKQALDRYWINF
ncbi:DUF6714 family protein [Aquimarina agarilytica]|uniref:DUF6714 family protein n=1 Tax=Aquimarina agarilytica TaxID=1087449 RepID=UPI000288AEB2|nr:DUF6714 family protein [Aquimarina agarilytica]